MNEEKNTNYKEEKDDALSLQALTSHEPFFVVPSKVFEYGLTPYELSTLFYLMMRADNKTHSCYPSVSSMIKSCKMSDSMVRKSIHSLEEKEMIKIQRQYVSTRKGFNRQASNYYTIALFENHSPPIQETAPPYMKNSPPLYNIQSPPVPQTGEINKTKPIITKSNITIPTELSLCEAEEVEREKNTFLKLKGEWLEELKKDFSFEDDGVILVDRALMYLWDKGSAEYEGREYPQSELRGMLIEKTTPYVLRLGFENLRQSKAPVRSPVKYLGACIFGALVRGEVQVPSRSQKENLNYVYSAESTFDLDEFFEAAINRSWDG